MESLTTKNDSNVTEGHTAQYITHTTARCLWHVSEVTWKWNYSTEYKTFHIKRGQLHCAVKNLITYQSLKLSSMN